jgi:hypothetical protein
MSEIEPYFEEIEYQFTKFTGFYYDNTFFNAEYEQCEGAVKQNPQLGVKLL